MAPFDAIGRLVPKRFPNAFFDPTSRRFSHHAGAHRRHYPPVGNISQYTLDKRPPSTHLGFDRVDGADPVPKNAISVFFLGEQGPFSGKPAIVRHERFGVRAEERGNCVDVSL
jgi:hypothetical protein